MNSILAKPTTATFSANPSAKPINFYYAVPEAKSVHLMGDFNNWNPKSLPMQRRADGWWSIQVPLSAGDHQYLFLVDGIPTLDPHAVGTAHGKRYASVSIIAVS